MKRKKIYRDHLLKVLLTAEEYAAFRERFGRTTFRLISDYQRALLLGKPVGLYYRNRSQDEFLEIAGPIMETLRAIERRWTQAVQNLTEASPVDRSRLDAFIGEERVLLQTLTEIKSLIIKVDKDGRSHPHDPGVQ